MGRPKLSLAFADGDRLVEKGWRALRASGVVSHAVAVVSPEDPLEWLRDAPEATVVRCPESRLGMAYSIRAGLRAARRHSPDAVLVALADQPFLTPMLFKRLACAFLGSLSLDFAACDYGSFTAPPAIFSPRVYDVLEALEGDAGARKLLNDDAYDGIRIPIEDGRIAMDVDTPEDWQTAQRMSSEMFGYKF